MAKLEDLFPIADLDRALQDGYVSRRLHPRLPLQIFNYTAQAQWENYWTPVTRQCRGLIAELLTHEIVARPFPKFFNLGQPGAETPGTMFRAYAKMDGSLGILYPVPDGHAIATRGSFESEQAIRGTAIWQEKYANLFDVPQSVTLLFEIIYPENRIVVDYRGAEDLYLLAAIDTESGQDISTNLKAITDYYFWPGPVAKEFEFRSLDHVQQAITDGEGIDEGVVLVWGSGSRVKVKTEEYLRLHRLITGLTPRRIWEHLAAGGVLSELMERVPDEFGDWVLNTASQMLAEVYEIEARAKSYATDTKAAAFENRREMAAHVNELPQPYPGLVFGLIDGKDMTERVWRLVRPSGADVFRAMSEDVA